MLLLHYSLYYDERRVRSSFIYLFIYSTSGGVSHLPCGLRSSGLACLWPRLSRG